MSSNDSRLARRLNLKDAVILGLGSMVGAGIFAAAGPAAQVAGSGLLFGVLIAALIAFLNATTMAQLAAVYPESGGAYVYGRKRLGDYWGFLAGWGFVIGKLASCTAMALTFAYYAFPEYAKPVAIAAVITLTITNYLGIKKTAFVTQILVILVLSSLAIVAFAALSGGNASFSRLSDSTMKGGVSGVLEAAALMFFAFAGYARIATLGEEVIDPKKTIPKAIISALSLTLIIYLLIIGSAVLTVDIEQLANSKAPLLLAVQSGSFAFLSPLVRFGACCASLSVLLSLMAGISRTVFSMAANSDLPRFFSVVHPQYKVPHRAELAVGLIIASIVGFADLRGAIGFSSFAILMYYSIANVASLKLSINERLWPKFMAALGLLGCVVVAFSLPMTALIGGFILFGIGSVVFVMTHYYQRRHLGS